jgi:preprotein translocase SecF subunit
MLRLFDPKTPWDFVGKMPIATKIGFALPVISIALLLSVGVNWGIDFAGGTELQVKFSQAVSSNDIRGVLSDAGFEKKQVQQYGGPDDHEMLVRIERLTSMKDADVVKISDLLKGELAALAPGATDTEVKVDFKAEEGDRINVHLPVPVVSGPAPKKTDAAAIETMLTEKLSAGDEKLPLDDAAIDVFSAAGFDRAAVAAKAKELGFEVTAQADKLREPNYNADIAQDNALRAQERTLASLLDERSGYKLRRTKQDDQAEATTEDAIHRDEPYKGRVKYLVHFEGVSKEIVQALEGKFGEVELRRVDFVDAKVAEQLRTDGLLAVLLAMLFILIYIAVRFDVFFSPGAVLALLHDSLAALILYPALQLEFDLPSIAALLTVVGYSINNTIVIFDRIREVTPKETKAPLSDGEIKTYVNQAINETFSRTINTTLTTLFASAALFLLAGGVVRNFAAVLSVGILLGAFSSTFLAPASYLFFRKAFTNPEAGPKKKSGGLSREDKARGVV